MYHKMLELLNKGVAVDEARRQLREADREPDILQRFMKRGEALKNLKRPKKASMILSWGAGNENAL
jgi:hypothetical protein